MCASTSALTMPTHGRYSVLPTSYRSSYQCAIVAPAATRFAVASRRYSRMNEIRAACPPGLLPRLCFCRAGTCPHPPAFSRRVAVSRSGLHPCISDRAFVAVRAAWSPFHTSCGRIRSGKLRRVRHSALSRSCGASDLSIWSRSQVETQHALAFACGSLDCQRERTYRRRAACAW